MKKRGLARKGKVTGLGNIASSIVRGKPRNVLTMLGLRSVFPHGRMFPKTRK
jgi:hypothetical protein